MAWVTPAGTRDEGGKVQPAYLNFDLTLLSTPAHNTLEVRTDPLLIQFCILLVVRFATC